MWYICPLNAILIICECADIPDFKNKDKKDQELS